MSLYLNLVPKEICTLIESHVGFDDLCNMEEALGHSMTESRLSILTYEMLAIAPERGAEILGRSLALATKLGFIGLRTELLSRPDYLDLTTQQLNDIFKAAGTTGDLPFIELLVLHPGFSFSNYETFLIEYGVSHSVDEFRDGELGPQFGRIRPGIESRLGLSSNEIESCLDRCVIEIVVQNIKTQKCPSMLLNVPQRNTFEIIERLVLDKDLPSLNFVFDETIEGLGESLAVEIYRRTALSGLSTKKMRGHLRFDKPFFHEMFREACREADVEFLKILMADPICNKKFINAQFSRIDSMDSRICQLFEEHPKIRQKVVEAVHRRRAFTNLQDAFKTRDSSIFKHQLSIMQPRELNDFFCESLHNLLIPHGFQFEIEAVKLMIMDTRLDPQTIAYALSSPYYYQMYSEIIAILDQNPERLKRVLSCLTIEKQIEVLRQCNDITLMQVAGLALTEFCASAILPAVFACGVVSVLNYFGSQQG